ncbi:aminoglycoside N3'-acetyltransferase [Prevotella dentalis DSM 3688]|uniref:Aminoglycoside N(3)-acetyltransferase n=1 Tax=Prevotella dentalis (strain ATCC 49559 / DSM 3688 / JCM 13448 / NCTC 12043 / ES 2772) TaxID=908937 RepID=F9D0N9_PREDD|nr:AAC(3) family N-acetyltransferase [Prevotella dentalis]AGB27740.1 aminoglycoside N3'-acetyltransferase [Prevotella dentalis DSM 3688]EGQ16568.1 aminoglycoside N3-acetyltransferase [Prevotella dentalis DSM 3688]
MRQSALTTLGMALKRVTGIRDFSLLRKNLHKRMGMLVYHRTYTADDIVGVMCALGMRAGSVVCIHASMKEFYNYRGTAEELIARIQQTLTPEGTLLMPAYPDPALQHDDSRIFDPAHDKTFAGHLAETFRQSPGVKRSINVQHSVCAWGRHADWLLHDHSHCANCWDEDSPWYRMTTLGALVFTLGLDSHYIGTFDHCVEALLYKEHPYWAQFFTLRKTYRYYNPQGQVRQYSCVEGDLERRTHEMTLIRHFGPAIYRKTRLSNLLVKVFESKPCLDKMLELGRKGVTMYYVPSPKRYKF